MNTNLSLSFIILLLLSFNLLIGQDNFNAIEDVILVNNKPYLVQMSKKGDILSFKKDLKNSFATISNITRKELFLEDIVIPGNENSVLKSLLAMQDSGANPSSKVESIDVSIDEKSEGTVVAMSDEMTAKGAPSINYDYDFAFDHRSATLSFSSVNQLNQVADLLLKNESANAYVNSFFFESVDVSKILSKNRTKAIKDVLILRGVDSSRINITESNNKDWGNNRVKVSIY